MDDGDPVGIRFGRRERAIREVRKRRLEPDRRTRGAASIGAVAGDAGGAVDVLAARVRGHGGETLAAASTAVARAARTPVAVHHSSAAATMRHVLSEQYASRSRRREHSEGDDSRGPAGGVLIGLVDLADVNHDRLSVAMNGKAIEVACGAARSIGAVRLILRVVLRALEALLCWAAI